MKKQSLQAAVAAALVTWSSGAAAQEKWRPPQAGSWALVGQDEQDFWLVDQAHIVRGDRFERSLESHRTAWIIQAAITPRDGAGARDFTFLWADVDCLGSTYQQIQSYTMGRTASLASSGSNSGVVPATTAAQRSAVRAICDGGRPSVPATNGRAAVGRERARLAQRQPPETSAALIPPDSARWRLVHTENTTAVILIANNLIERRGAISTVWSLSIPREISSSGVSYSLVRSEFRCEGSAVRYTARAIYDRNHQQLKIETFNPEFSSWPSSAYAQTAMWNAACLPQPSNDSVDTRRQEVETWRPVLQNAYAAAQ